MFKRIREIFKKKELDEDKKDLDLEKGDFLALMIALSYYVFPVLIGVFLLLFIVSWLIFF